MGGDLNLKKSWHPVLMRNQKRVWEEQQKARDERKKIEQSQREREEERAREELRKLQEASGGKADSRRIDWMYSGPGSGSMGSIEQAEEYLLGKKSVESLVRTGDRSNADQQPSQNGSDAGPSASSLRDTASKVRDDPLLAIKRLEEAALEARMNDPALLRRVMKEQGTSQKDQKRSHRSRDERHDRHHRHRRDEDDHRSRRRSSPGRRRRSHSYSSSRSRSRSPRRQRHSDRERVDERDSYSRHRRRSGSRRSSPRRTSHASNRYVDNPTTSRSDTKDRRPRTRSPCRQKDMESHRNDQPKRSEADESADRERRLAEMQSNAQSLESERRKRVDDTAAQEEQERSQDYKSRSGKADFVAGLHKQAQSMSLAESLERKGGRYLQSEA